MAKVQLMDNGAVDEDGLTEQEREYLAAPFSKLDEDQRRTAMAIKDKQIANRFAANEEQRRADEAKRTKYK